MKDRLLLLCLTRFSTNVAAVVASAAPSSEPFRALTVPYATLLEGSESIQASDVLQELQRVGMVTIVDVPKLKQSRAAALSWNFHSCIENSPFARANWYPDGTLRRTLATHTLPHEGANPLRGGSDSASCQDFIDASESFRQVVGEVTRAFAAFLSPLLVPHHEDSGPLLVSPTNERFSTFAEIVNNGEHLEHFHSYQHLPVFAESKTNESVDTIEMHTDQGLFLLFSPGRMVHQDGTKVDTLSSGFVIELSDGSRATVHFNDDDGLVVLLGDGVNQYINPRLRSNQSLRAVPHALQLPLHSRSEARVWYGRMVLPPSAALHPKTGFTFGQLREALVAAPRTHSSDSEADLASILALGCSTEDLVARQLEETSCEADTLYCWHRCMRLADYNVSEDSCHKQGKDVFCIDASGHLWDGSHGDFFPGCATNGTEIGGGTIMYMFGFRLFLDGQRPFLNFYFVGWTLNNNGKLFGAMIAIFVMGVLVESIVKLRQRVVQRARSNRWSAKSVGCAVTLLHGSQELFGYLLMLATMTYSVEFLFMAAVGLATGHALFAKMEDGTAPQQTKGADADSCSERADAEAPEA